MFQGRGNYLKRKVIFNSGVWELSSDGDFSKEPRYPPIISIIGNCAPFSKAGMINQYNLAKMLGKFANANYLKNIQIRTG